eukprot:Protomagalhaensia_wolfi_Nauph_80__5323@NODE_576_length_2269_cov_114_491928_g431_i0_p1_GENE_NODE_576_length_2269_cov_114_491928_g431_i0NODE_576_length_2269_cov_114_491928_g431_i0_p1_ORF_typecomplete_len357_score43_92DNaseRNase/PF02577_14/0_23_NODE_576_length_2269_cov_114_491928_g431_i08991969
MRSCYEEAEVSDSGNLVLFAALAMNPDSSAIRDDHLRADSLEAPMDLDGTDVLRERSRIQSAGAAGHSSPADPGASGTFRQDEPSPSVKRPGSEYSGPSKKLKGSSLAGSSLAESRQVEFDYGCTVTPMDESDITPPRSRRLILARQEFDGGLVRFLSSSMGELVAEYWISSEIKELLTEAVTTGLGSSDDYIGVLLTFVSSWLNMPEAAQVRQKVQPFRFRLFKDRSSNIENGDLLQDSAAFIYSLYEKVDFRRDILSGYILSALKQAYPHIQFKARPSHLVNLALHAKSTGSAKEILQAAIAAFLPEDLSGFWDVAPPTTRNVATHLLEMLFPDQDLLSCMGCFTSYDGSSGSG